ncbi:MAG: alpha/beta hydrolase [Hyphomicrobiales bacterium]|nr:alpha/beta hydrolase [Hyphomicrobiales bacterium]
MSDVAKTPLLRRDDGEMLAYRFTPGRQPGVVFMTGYMSDMTGGKALRLEDFCRARGNAYLRFDYLGHGESTGAFTDGTIGRWADDAVFALDQLTEGPQVLVGSSLGGWIMVLAALRRRDRITGLLGIASAPDFTEDLIPLSLSDAQKDILERDGVVPVASPYDPEPTPVTKLILDEGRNHLVLRDEIPIDCPVRLIHGLDDPDVPWQTSLTLMQRLRSDDVELNLVKAGGHRMSEPDDLERLCATLEQLLRRVEDPDGL